MAPTNDDEATPVTVNFRGQPFSFRFHGHVSPAVNRQLDEREQARAHLLADRIGELRAAAPGFDSEIAKGANNWAGAMAGGWHPFFDKATRRFDHLRLFCQPFTGFDPIDNTLRGEAPRSIPADVDTRIGAHVNISIAMIELLSDQRRLPERIRVRLPAIFGESGPVCDGIVASYDSWSLQKQMNGLYGSGVLSRLEAHASRNGKATIVDIGSGFGGLLYQLAQALPSQKLRLVAVDLPDSLLFATVYLSTLWVDRHTYIATPDGYLSTATWQTTKALPEDFAVVFAPNYLAEPVVRSLGPVDLITNFRSMQEMSDEQVAHYGALARESLGDDGLLYEQNDMTRSIDRDVKAILAKVLPHGSVIAETDPEHRPMGQVSVWSNRPVELTRPTS